MGTCQTQKAGTESFGHFGLSIGAQVFPHKKTMARCLLDPFGGLLLGRAPQMIPKILPIFAYGILVNISWCSPHVPSFTSHLLHAILRLCPWAHGPAAEPVLCPVAHSLATGPTFCVANLSNSDGGKECRYVQVSSPILHVTVNHHMYSVYIYICIYIYKSH